MNVISNVDSLSALIDRLVIETIKQTHLIHRKKTVTDPAEYVEIDKAQMAVNEVRSTIKNRIDELMAALVPGYHVQRETRTL